MASSSTVLRGLNKGQAAVESIMVDAVRVYRNTGGRTDDVLDEASGRLLTPSGHLTVVYDETSTGDDGRSLAHESGLGGIAKVSPLSGTAAAGTSDANPDETENRLKISLPLDAPAIQRYDWIKITYAERDAQLLDIDIIVDDIVLGSLKVARQLIGTLYTVTVR